MMTAMPTALDTELIGDLGSSQERSSGVVGAHRNGGGLIMARPRAELFALEDPTPV
jgi:hypothetical protein